MARKVSEGVSPYTLRLWRNPPSAVIGRFQDAEAEVDLTACRSCGAAVVRRFTGGGAVYHDLGTVNCTLAFSRPSSSSPNPIKLFELFCRGVIGAINAFKVQGDYAPPNEVTVNGKKMVGAAASLRWHTNFVHGSILVNTDASEVWKALRREPRTKGYERTKYVRSRVKPVVSLCEVLLQELPLQTFKHELVRSFERILSVKFMSSAPSEDELKEAGRLLRKRYSSDFWNLGIAPRGFNMPTLSE